MLALTLRAREGYIPSRSPDTLVPEGPAAKVPAFSKRFQYLLPSSAMRILQCTRGPASTVHHQGSHIFEARHGASPLLEFFQPFSLIHHHLQNASMGSVPSRDSPYLMPGTLSLDSVSTVLDDGTPCATNDASAIASDVIDPPPPQKDDHNHPDDPEGLVNGSSLSKSKSPGLISFSGLREPFQPLDSLASGSDPTTPRSTSTPSSSDSSVVVTPTSFIPNMIDIQLHSPNSQIVGTPFATSNTPFEYPFPTDSSSSTSSSARVSHFPSPASSSMSVAPPSPSHILPPVAVPNGSIAYRPHAMPMSGDFPLPPPGQIHLTHPKMRTTPPPIPPSLLKKQQDKLQNRARRLTVDASATALAHDSVHHAASDGSLNARGRLNGHEIKT